MAAELNIWTEIILAAISFFFAACGFYFITKFQLKSLTNEMHENKSDLKEIKDTLTQVLLTQTKTETEVTYLKDEIRSYKEIMRKQL